MDHTISLSADEEKAVTSQLVPHVDNVIDDTVDAWLERNIRPTINATVDALNYKREVLLDLEYKKADPSLTKAEIEALVNIKLG